MWPFKNKTSIPAPVLSDAMDELGLVRLNQLQDAMGLALQKHFDPANLHSQDDASSGHFDQEFNLLATPGRMKSVYAKEPWVYTTCSLIARTLATIPFDVVNKDTKEIEPNHPLNDILKTGNVLQDALSLDWTAGIDLVTTGNAFLVLDKKNNAVIHVPVEYVTLKGRDIVKDGQSPIEGIEINRSMSLTGSGSIDTAFVPYEEVIHYKLPNPYSPYVGLSMLAAASRPILLDRHKNEFEMAFYLRGATNAGVIETSEDMTKPRMERLLRTFENAYTGRRNWFRQLFLPKGAKWVNSGLTMSEMQHLEGLRENRITLLAVLGVPPMKVGIVQDVNRSTAEIQNQTFYENTIIPLSSMIAAGWNNSYLVRRKFKNEVEVVPNFDGIDAVEGGIITRGEQAKALDNIATINEQREIAKLAPLKETDPRGNMFLVELQRIGGFGADAPSVPSENLGPEDDVVGEIHEVEIGAGNGENEHTHSGEVDDNGNGKTTDTQGEGPAHEHEILNGEVQPGGVDGHGHPNVELTVEDEKRFQRIKRVAVDTQNAIEEGQGTKFLRSYERYFLILIEQTKEALHLDIHNILSYLQSSEQVELRTSQYQNDGLEVLDATLDKGFTLGLSQTRSALGIQRKAIKFSPTDEMAIDLIKERTRDDKRRTLAQRNIETFHGFDKTRTEEIQKVVEDGLKEGLTTDNIAKTIETKYGERYGDQAFTIARTETLFAISQGLAWQHEAVKEVFSEVNKQWFHVGDVRSNPDARIPHAGFERDGKAGIVPSEYVWTNDVTGAQLRYPRDPQAGAGDVINCRCTMVTVVPDGATSNADQILNRG